MLEWRQLRYFVTVSGDLHFTKAADRLHVAQSGFGTQVKQLEALRAPGCWPEASGPQWLSPTPVPGCSSKRATRSSTEVQSRGGRLTTAVPGRSRAERKRPAPR